MLSNPLGQVNPAEPYCPIDPHSPFHIPLRVRVSHLPMTRVSPWAAPPTNRAFPKGAWSLLRWIMCPDLLIVLKGTENDPTGEGPQQL